VAVHVLAHGSGNGGWRARYLSTGHDALLNEPAVVASLLDTLAR
jgi:hypothetical protein